MSAILAIQALVFQDGGILALGANITNMAIVGVLAGYLPYHLWGRGRGRLRAEDQLGFRSRRDRRASGAAGAVDNGMGLVGRVPGQYVVNDGVQHVRE